MNITKKTHDPKCEHTHDPIYIEKVCSHIYNIKNGCIFKRDWIRLALAALDQSMTRHDYELNQIYNYLEDLLYTMEDEMMEDNKTEELL